MDYLNYDKPKKVNKISKCHIFTTPLWRITRELPQGAIEWARDVYKNSDPIEIVRAEILKKKLATESELEKISKEIIEEVKAAADFALESKFPSSEELYTDVYI